jgi:hypothetical protein
MSVVTLTPAVTSRAGINQTVLAVAPDASAGCRWLNTGAETLVVINGGGSPITVTLVYNAAAVFDGVAVANKTVSVLAGDSFEIGPFSQAFYNDVNGYITVLFSSITTVTVLARRNGSQ